MYCNIKDVVGYNIFDKNNKKFKNMAKNFENVKMIRKSSKVLSSVNGKIVNKDVGNTVDGKINLNSNSKTPSTSTTTAIPASTSARKAEGGWCTFPD